MEAFLQNIFICILNMSITGSYVILFVMLLRQFLKKLPKIISYSLWIVVLFRLTCPFSFSSALSFFNALGFKGMEHIPYDIGLMKQPEVNIGITSLNQAINNSLPTATEIASVNPMQVITFGLSVAWIMGIFILLVYSITTYVLLKRKVSTAILTDNYIYKCDNIQSPFVLGIFKPKIYLPVGLNETELCFILKHEQIHIERRDYIIKPLSFIVLCIHWFNPLVWVGFVLMCKDMEMSCDERVLKEIGTDARRDYCAALLNQAVNKRLFSVSPIAFGENSAKSRIKNVLNFKKPAFWLAFIAIIVSLAAGIFCLADPKVNNDTVIDSGKDTNVFESIISDLSRLPKKYTVEEQVKDGCFVIVHGNLKSDANIIEKFVADSKSGKSAKVTIVQYTIEGDPIVTKVVYDGSMFYGVSDNSRDAFKGDYDDYIKFQYKYLKTFEENKSRFALLVNDDSLTVEKYRKSMLSSNSKDWIDHYFLYNLTSD